MNDGSWVSALEPVSESPRSAQRAHHTPDDGQRFRRAVAYVEQMPAAISGQGGHAATWAVARKCAADFQLNEPDTLSVLRHFNQRCEPPWSDAELAHKAHDAVNKHHVANPVEDRPRQFSMPDDRRAFRAAEDPEPDDGYVHTDNDAPTEAPRTTTKIKVLTTAEIFGPLEEPEYLIDGVIRRASITELMAYGGSAKTWFAIAMAVAVGSGSPFLGRFPTKKGKVLYLDWESGTYEMRRRLKANAAACDLTEHPDVALCCMPPLNLAAEDFAQKLATIAAGFDLIVIDTLKAATPGVDENSSDMRSGIDRMRPYIEQTGAAVVILLHSKKSPPGLTVDALDGREMGRGSSAIFDAADSVFWLRYEKGKPQTVHHTKARLGRIVPPFELTVEDVNGGVLVSARGITEPEAMSLDKKFDELCDRVLDAVRVSPGLTSDLLREKVHARKSSVVAALEQLERNGAVRNGGDTRKGKWTPTSAPEPHWSDGNDE